MGDYIDKDDLVNRVTARTLAQLTDDDDDGDADDVVVDDFIADAEGYVNGFLRPIYTQAIPLNPVPAELKRLVLDVCEARLQMRFPEHGRGDGAKMLAAVRTELMDLRKGTTSLGVEGTPEPATSHGAETYADGDLVNECVAKPTFLGGFGSF